MGFGSAVRLVLPAVLAACDQPEQTPPDWGDVAPLLDRCSGCHRSDGLALPITDFDDASRIASIVASMVESRQMPPWRAGPADVTYADDPSLTDDEIATIVAWADAGAPLGGGDPHRALVAPEERALPRIDATLRMTEPYAPQGDPTDDHRCFVLDRSDVGDAVTFVSGIQVAPTDLSAAHHMTVLSLVPTDPDNTPVLADAGDPGPGWACSPIDTGNAGRSAGPSGGATTVGSTSGGASGPSPSPATVGVTSHSFPGAYQQVGGWLPGRTTQLLPPGVGVELDPDAMLLLKAHYYTPGWSGVPDLTVVNLALVPSVDRRAAEMQVSNPMWSRHVSVAVAAHDTATHTLTQTVTEAGRTLPIDTTGGVTVHWVLLHMHETGASASLVLIRESGDKLTLLDIPTWDFDWQLEYWLETPLDLEPGDRLRVKCVHENPTDADVWWGEDSADEMCMARLLVSER